MQLVTEHIVNILKAAGETTRLRVLMLLADGELNVKDLTRILGQSQPRISRHLKLMCEAGLIKRSPEGSWVYFRLTEDKAILDIVKSLIGNIDHNDAIISKDQARATIVKQERAETAQKYFKEHASEWDKIRALHFSEAAVENAMQSILKNKSYDTLVDLGTGTGRILELFSENIEHGVGIDMNPDMLVYARSKIEAGGLKHCQIRHGDLSNLPIEHDFADIVILHQVLHFIDDPIIAIEEAARILKTNGSLLIVDFAPHELEFLREKFAHIRLGFSKEYMSKCLEEVGLKLVEHKSLKPHESTQEDKLVVSMWLAQKPDSNATSSTNKQSNNQLETVSIC